jgi:hypothetical protein
MCYIAARLGCVLHCSPCATLQPVCYTAARVLHCNPCATLQPVCYTAARVLHCNPCATLQPVCYIAARGLDCSPFAACVPQAMSEPLPYQLYLGRTPSYDRLHEVLDTASGVPELHVEYCEYGWYVYRRPPHILGTETSPLGEERTLVDNRSQFIRRRDEEQCTVLPNVVMRWVFYNECLVYQLVAQRYHSESMAGHVVCTLTAATRPQFVWQDTHGTDWCARAVSWHDGVAWVIRFDAYSRSSPRSVLCFDPARSSPQIPARHIPSLVYSRSRRAWLLGRDGEAVPRRIARQLSSAIGFQTRDGFW